MLKHLYIKNYALIDELDIELHPGFSVITGETGAGKSIILGAIALLLGQRADSKALKNDQQKCIIEATFILNNEERIIRRELAASGKSRGFIDDELATLAEMKELGERLLDVHSQHQNLLLQKEDFQLNILDIMAGNTSAKDGEASAIESFADSYHCLKNAQRELDELRESLKKANEDEELMRFQLQEIVAANLTEDEDRILEEEKETATHAEDIKNLLYECCNMLDNDEIGIVGNMRQVSSRMGNAATMNSALEELRERVESSYIEIKDIASEIESELDRVNFDPERLQYINDRLDTIYSLQKKHNATTISDLLAKQEELQIAIDAIDGGEEALKEKESEVKELHDIMARKADELSTSRKAITKSIEEEIIRRLSDLGMPNVEFEIEITEKEFCETGHDRVSFLFSANKGMAKRPVAQVASGGEIARLMLALKSLISGAVKLPTIIFDEIDTGVSGKIAEQMAHIMREMGDSNRQVISITHLPQIAALGQHHYKVEKTENLFGTTSVLRELSKKERITEVAQMLSGSEITQAAMENAQQLLEL